MEEQKTLEIPEETPKQKFVVIGDHIGLGTAFIKMALEQGHEVLFWAFKGFNVPSTEKVMNWTVILKKFHSINWFEFSDESIVIVEAQSWSEAKENLHLYSAAEVPVIFLDPKTDKKIITNPINHVLIVSPSSVPEINSLAYDFVSIKNNNYGLLAKEKHIEFGVDSFIYSFRVKEDKQFFTHADFFTNMLTDAGYRLMYDRSSTFTEENQPQFLFELKEYSVGYFGQIYSFLFEDREQMLSLSSMLSVFMSETDHYGEYEKPIVDEWRWSILKKDKTLGFGYRYAGNCLAFMWFSNQQNILNDLFSRHYGLGKFFAICSSPEFKPRVWDMLDLA